MGQYFSSTNANQNQSFASTPQRIPNCSDPRSPTRDIDRTPIQVSQTLSDENSSSIVREEKSQPKSLRQKIFEKKNKTSNNSE